jgi:uncharacterized phiE125 gp8 family phage protein
MAYSNYINDFRFIPFGPITEPVTLEEAKNYCRILNLNADDDLIEMLITQSREAVEAATGLSLIRKNVITYFNNISGDFDIPFGPIDIDSFELFDMNQDELEITGTNLQLIGDEYPKLSFPRYANLKATYDAGFVNVPADLKIAILDQISYSYENRGLDADTGICNKTWKACQRWTRVSPIL